MSTQQERHPDTRDEQARPQGSTPMPPAVAPDAAPGHHDAATRASPTKAEQRGVVIVPVPASAATPQTLTPRGPASAAREAVHIAPNIRELIAAAPLATPQELRAAREQRDLNKIVHGVLMVGLLISTLLMLVGVGLDLLFQRDLSAAIPDLGEVAGRVLAFRPSGFLALGLLVLIATPILRVVSSIGAFVYERDWRFASLTIAVLAVLLIGLLLGRG